MKKAGLEYTKESKSILYWRTKLCTASRNFAHTTNMWAYICMLCTQFVTPSRSIKVQTTVSHK